MFLNYDVQLDQYFLTLSYSQVNEHHLNFKIKHFQSQTGKENGWRQLTFFRYGIPSFLLTTKMFIILWNFFAFNRYIFNLNSFKCFLFHEHIKHKL